jgi:hypothetical protein
VGRWFDTRDKSSKDFLALAAFVLTEEEYMNLWVKLDHSIGSWMQERGKPYDVWNNHNNNTKRIYFETVEDAILYRLSVT